MAKVTPNIASTVVAGVMNKKVAMNPSKSVGHTSTFAGFDPKYTAGDRQKITPSDKYSARNSGNGNKIFVNEARRPGVDGIDEKFYAHIA